MNTKPSDSSLVGTLLRRLIEDKHTTVEQVAEVCEVSPSTVYRWTRGLSEPDFDRVARLVRKVTVPEVRRSLVEIFTRGLPLELEWADGSGEAGAPTNADTMDLCLLTVSCLGQVMLNQRRAMSDGSFTNEAKADLQRLMAGAQAYLAAARKHLDEHPVSRKKARPLR